MRRTEWGTVLIFFMTLLGWILISDKIGMGTVALLGAATFLVTGLVRWEDVNSGVNWGVILLYAAAISLGVEMKVSGAAEWLAETILSYLAPFGADHGLDKPHSFVKEGLVVVVRQLRLPVPGRIEVDPVLGLRDGDLEGLGPSEAVPVLSGAIVSEETIADWPDHTR